MSEAVRKIKEHIRNAKGTRFSLEDLPFEVVHSDHDYGKSKYGYYVQFVFQVPVVEHTQTPRMAYVSVVAVLHPEEGIEDPSEWTVTEVERKTRAVTVWEKKK